MNYEEEQKLSKIIDDLNDLRKCFHDKFEALATNKKIKQLDTLKLSSELSSALRLLICIREIY